MKIHLYHANAGHGHRKVAEVIAETLHRRGLSRNEVEISDALDKTPAIFRASYPATYFYAVKYAPKGWGWVYETLDKPAIYNSLKWIRTLQNGIMGGGLIKHVQKENPDVIICTHFFTAELFATAKKRGQIRSTLVTVVTDFYPHSLWVNEGTDFYWVMGEEGKNDLIRRGVSVETVFAGGIPVADAFKPSGQKKEILKKWNFELDRFTLLFTSGSFGLGKQEAILKQLEPFKDKVQCFVVCGNNKELSGALKKQQWLFPIQIFDFIDFMPELMEASDLILAKSGGSTTTESLAKGLPMVILDPIPGQETRNANLLLSRNASFTMAEPEQIRVILKAIFENPRLLPEKHAEIKKLARPNAADDLVTFVLNQVSGRKP